MSALPTIELLTLNVGSSSVRAASYRASSTGVVALRRVHLDGASPRPLRSVLDELGLSSPRTIAHRVVHGGARLTATCEVDAHVEAEILRLESLAPLHNRNAAEWMATCRAELPEATQVAVFDTAFFTQLPEVSTTYALPRELCRRLGIKRYGFHGIAHESMWKSWQHASRRDGLGKLVSFQLGSGCSAAAILDGVPVDTSMGMTPTEGLVMATRCGDVDPGAILHLARESGVGLRDLEKILNEQSGLRGIAGDGDVRHLLGSDSADASLAIDVYCQRARKYLGAYLAVLGGANVVAFGGGVGEHEPEIRSRICAGAAFCGLRLDEAANTRGVVEGRPTRVSAPGSAIEVWIIPIDEEAVLAEQAWTITKGRT